MKKILIGRGTGNDIRLKDESDRVSRRQAVIEVSLFGKMRIHDTSSNGTFVNGERVEKPGGREVKRGDKVDFAHVMELDWNLVKDPYKGLKIAAGIFIVALLAAAALLFIFADDLTKREVREEKEKTEQTETIAEDSPAVDSTPAETAGKGVVKQKPRKRQHPKTPIKNDNNKEVDKGDALKNPDVVRDPKGLKPENGPKRGGSMKNEKK